VARRPDVGEGELEVLKVLWDRDADSVREVREDLKASGRELAHNTVQTVLGRLVDKGFATRSEASAAGGARGHTYRPHVTRDQLGRRRLRDLLFGIHDGMAGPLVMQLVRSGKLQSEEVDELRSLLDDLASESRPAAGEAGEDR